jgi:hypothetical protein
LPKNISTGLLQAMQLNDRTDSRVKLPTSRWILVAALMAFCWAVSANRSLHAQGVTSGMIRGNVVAADSSSVDGAQVRIVNTATGFEATAVVVRGQFLRQGLAIGGPYQVTVTRIGFQPERQDQLVLKLGETLELKLVLQPQSVVLDTLTVVANAGFPRINAHGGTATTLSDSLVHQLPTLNRNFLDFMPLAPQVSTKVGFQRTGVSAAGANYRFNRFLINGADERFVNSNLPAGGGNGKSIPLEAVKEYQVLIAPFDVRYGDFAGAVVNTVTNSGNNQLRGSTNAFWRNDRLARADTSSSPYDRLQYGFALSGPIVHDRLHFFLAPEFQRLVAPPTACTWSTSPRGSARARERGRHRETRHVDAPQVRSGFRFRRPGAAGNTGAQRLRTRGRGATPLAQSCQRVPHLCGRR